MNPALNETSQAWYARAGYATHNWPNPTHGGGYGYGGYGATEAQPWQHQNAPFVPPGGMGFMQPGWSQPLAQQQPLGHASAPATTREVTGTGLGAPGGNPERPRIETVTEGDGEEEVRVATGTIECVYSEAEHGSESGGHPWPFAICPYEHTGYAS